MNTSKINNILKGIYNKLIDSVENKEIKELIKNSSYITGGAIPSMLMDAWVNDFDIYMTDEEAARNVKHYYEQNKNNKAFKVNLITGNAINLSDKVQIVIKFTGKPNEVIKEFDFKHLKCYWTYNDGLSIPLETYKLINDKELVYTGSKYPLSSLLRLRKYINKGWHVSAATITHIATQYAEGMLDSFTIKHEEPVPIGTRGKYEIKWKVEDIMKELNGVDPLTIQVELQKRAKEYLELDEIINLIK